MSESQQKSTRTDFTIAIKTCIIGIISLILSTISVIGIGLLFILGRSHLNSPLFSPVALLTVAMMLLGACLAVISLSRIAISHGNIVGSGYAMTSLCILLLIVLAGIVIPALARVRKLAFRMTCGTNLAGIGKAMLIYANDYEDLLPKAGGRTNHWTDSLGSHGNDTNWFADRRQEAFGQSHRDDTGFVTVSSSLFLLVKYAEVTPISFVCKGETDTHEFQPKKWLPRKHKKELTDLWDFGYFASEEKNQAKHVSYSYHHPYGENALTVSHRPTMAIAADRNPWLDARIDNRQDLWAGFMPDNELNTSSSQHAKRGNSLSHKSQGQNVLFLDSHVAFEKRSFVGVDHDNIYTIQDSNDPSTFTRGRIPTAYDADASAPRTRSDSVLLQENGQPGKKP